MIIRKRFMSKFKRNKEMPGLMTSTPNGSETEATTADISIIEPACSLPGLVSTESLDLESIIFEEQHASLVHPATGAEIVQHAGHCTLSNYLTPNAIRRKLGLGKRVPCQDPNSNLSNYMNRLVKELQKSVNIIDKKSKPNVETAPIESPESPEESPQPNLTELNLITRKLAKSSSPFKENFALQTIQTTTKRTSPLQNVTKTTKTTIGLQDSDSNFVTVCSEMPRAARSYPSTPREASQSLVNSRSRSQSPPPKSQDPTASQRLLTTTLKDIIGKITSTFLTPDSKSPDYSGTECTQSRFQIPRGVRFARPEGRADYKTRDVQELYFNKDIMNDVQSFHGPYNKQGFGSAIHPPWVQVARPYSKNENFRSPNNSSPLACGCDSPLGSAVRAPCPCLNRSSTSSQPMILPRSPPQSSRPPMPSRPQTAPARPFRSSFRPTQSLRLQSPAPLPRQSQPYQPSQPQPQPQPQPPNYPPCSTTDTGLGGSESVCSLQNKLLATQLCLKNKEETVRVQSESLACAEQRIAMLTLRAAQQRCELEDLQRAALSKQRQQVDTNSCCEGPSVPCCNADECCQADAEVERQKIVVRTLQDNLSVIEELYRECFYETAKQEDLIEKLRKSYLDVRLMEKEKADQIGRLENVVNSQKWSLETCQGVALEVENLKMEILNFMNSSNNDSGVWEQSLAGEVGEDIDDIMQQLHQLREMLQGEECLDTCTLRKENQNLRALNCNLECKITALEEDKCKLEATIREKDNEIINLRIEKDDLCLEMRCLRTDLEASQKRVLDLDNENDCVRKQLKEAQGQVGETKSEIGFVRGENEELRRKNACLTEEMERADMIIKENLKIRSSVSYLTQQVALWRQQLEESEERVRCVEAELARARSHVRNVDQCYKEKADAVDALEAQLQEAHARGAQLCAESRRVVCTVRGWIRRMQATNKEQCQTIKEQESCIAQLADELREEKQKQKPLQQHRHERCSPRADCPRSPPPPPPCARAGHYTSHRAPRQLDRHEPPQMGGCAACARRPAPRDDVIVGCSKCAFPPRGLAGGGFRTEVTADYQVGCSQCAPNLLSKQHIDDETESGTCSLSHAAVACGCERDNNAVQATTSARSNIDDVASCSHIPVPPRRLLRKKLYSDRVAHFLRCTSVPGVVRSRGVQGPSRRDSACDPPPPNTSRIPRAVSPTSELLERVSHLNDAMEDSQRRWSRTKLTRPQRDPR